MFQWHATRMHTKWMFSTVSIAVFNIYLSFSIPWFITDLARPKTKQKKQKQKLKCYIFNVIKRKQKQKNLQELKVNTKWLQHGLAIVRSGSEIGGEWELDRAVAVRVAATLQNGTPTVAAGVGAEGRRGTDAEHRQRLENVETARGRMSTWDNAGRLKSGQHTRWDSVRKNRAGRK